LLKDLFVAGWPYIDDGELITGIIKKLPLLQRLTLWGGTFQKELLLALLDHCPRLELLDVTRSYPTFALWHKRITTRIRSCTIKDFRQPFIVLE
jgi:hypothetical protein